VTPNVSARRSGTLFGRPTKHLLNPTRRLEAAVIVLAFGDGAERARSAVWERTTGGLVVSPAALAAGADHLPRQKWTRPGLFL